MGIGPYQPYYPGGFQDLPSNVTPPKADALNYWDQWLATIVTAVDAGGGGGGGGTSVNYTAQSLTSSQIKQALLNIKAMPTLRPEQYGAAADGITDDSLAFYLCKQAGLAQASGAGYVIQLQQGVKYYLGQAAKTAHGLNGLFDMGTGCYISVPGGSGRAATGATTIIGDHTAGGYIIDCESAAVQGCGIAGIMVVSDMSGAISTAIGGVRFAFVAWPHFINAGVGNVSDIALNINGCVDGHFENFGLSHNITGRTLTDVTPTFFISGTDHVFINIQANGGNTNATIGNLSSGTNFYNPSIQLYNCDAAKFIGVNGEFGDVGWYIGGTSSAIGGGIASTHVSLNEFLDTRGDYNAAHGYYVVSMAWNQWHSVFVNNNSCNSNGVYNGMHLTNSAAIFANRFSTIIGASPSGATKIMGYYYADLATGAVSQLDSNIVQTIGGERQGMAYDYATWGTPFRFALIKGGAGSYIYRPASRHCAGQTWADLFAPTSPVLTYSDGGGAVTGSGGGLIGNGGWRNVATGAVIGNLLNAVTAECLGGVSTGWLGISFTGATTVTTATAAFQAVCFNTVAANGPAKLGLNQLLEVTCNAAGNTAGYMEVLTPAVVTGIAASTAYAACVSTVAGTTVRNVKFIIDCYSGTSLLSSITTDTGATNAASGIPTPHAFTFTTPVSCNAIQVRVRFTGVATSEKHYVGLTSVDTHSTQTIPVYS